MVCIKLLLQLGDREIKKLASFAEHKKKKVGWNKKI